MSWEPVVPIYQGGASTGIRSALRIDRANGSLRLVIAIGEDVMRVMRWQPGILMTVLRGSQSDLGRVRLSRAAGKQGYKLARLHSSKSGHAHYGLRLPPWFGMPTTPCRMSSCHWQVSDNRSFVEVHLPRWAISDHGFDMAEDAAERGELGAIS